MSATSHWVIQPDPAQQERLEFSRHVMAWALDSATRRPMYILDLDKSRAGNKSGCECPSCGFPLTGVNVAKSEYLKRPHFRHPNGAAEKLDCTFQASRIAALELLRSQGVIQLPGRRVRGQFVGLSGAIHEVWVHRPSQLVKISDFNFQDKACAVLTLEDGHQLRVLITGSGIVSSDPDSSNLPTIQLAMDQPGIAGLSLEELRSRLTLVPNDSCWVSHWADADLLRQADEEARQKALDLLDFAGEHASELALVDPKFQRKTLLHLKCKRILQEAGEILVPGLRVRVEDLAEDGFGVEHEWSRPSEMVPLLSVQLERKSGRVIPDVIAQVSDDHGGLLCIEVTVTNTISDERIARIRESRIASLEIDLSNAAGLISRVELQELVVHGLEIKRWLFHPELEARKAEAESKVAAAVLQHEAEVYSAEQHRLSILSTPIGEITAAYLSCIF